MPVGLFLPGPGPYNARNPERGVSAAITGPLTYEATILADGPALYWRLGESVGTTAEDETVNNRDGTYVGSPTLAATGAIADDADTAVILNGSSQYINSTYNPFANGTVRSFECWAYQDVAGGGESLIGGSVFDGPICIEIDTNEDLFFTPDAGVVGVVRWVDGWPGAGRWVHLVLVFDEPGDVAELYVNGVSLGTKAMAGQWRATPGNLIVGARGGPDVPLDGKLDEVAVYEYGLSGAQILAHYDAGSPSPAGLTLGTAAGQSAATLALTTPLPAYQTYALSLTPSLYWSLNSRTGTTDLSGNGRTGTGDGGVAVGANATSPLNGGSASTDFDGSDDWVYSSYDPFNSGTVRSFCGWAYRDTSSSYDGIFGFRLFLESGSNTVYFSAQGGPDFPTWTSAWPGNTQWVHWAIVFDDPGDLVYLYINGALVGSQTCTAYGASGVLFIAGTDYAGGNPFDGKLAHVGVWERGLTPTEISNLYASRLSPGLEELASAGQSSATLALTAPPKVTLATSAAQSAATLALTAPAKVTLATSAAVSSATLALSAPTQVPLATAACVASATCAVSIPSAAVEVPLATAACQSSATLALSAPALTTLQSSAAVSSATLALTAKPTFTLTAAAVSSATLALRAETRVTLGTSAAQSAATLALTAPTRVVLGTAAATSAATLALSAPTRVVLGSAAAQSAATLSLTAPTRVTLGTAATTSSATLALTATTQVPLQTSAAVASATLGLTAGGAPVPLATAAAICAATLSLKALTQIPLAPSAAQSSATLAVTVATRVVLQSGAAVSSATLSVSRAERVTLGAAAAVSSASLSVVILSPTPDTNPDLGGDVEENTTGGEVEEVLTGGTPVANITGGVPVATVTSGVVNEVLTGGIYDEVLTGGEPDDTTGGDPDLVSTGGEVNVVLTGGVVNEVLTGGTYDETLTGGEVQEVPTGDSPDESQRGGDYDLVLTGGEVL